MRPHVDDRTNRPAFKSIHSALGFLLVCVLGPVQCILGLWAGEFAPFAYLLFFAPPIGALCILEWLKRRQ
jgi:hypothetical protein